MKIIETTTLTALLFCAATAASAQVKCAVGQPLELMENNATGEKASVYYCVKFTPFNSICPSKHEATPLNNGGYKCEMNRLYKKRACEVDGRRFPASEGAYLLNARDLPTNRMKPSTTADKVKRHLNRDFSLIAYSCDL